ncbi:zf-TFIIB domain-containing protein [Agromyces subbeticus]|uniref:TFIIB-type zinc ribbon-containing protein n=1 Tax=Agromyces subbeticus TaxID=293890 RepID=UPI0003B7791A|nr:zf-TFIIB domain-containing protein [Agromyces subbeticus]
MQCPSDGTVLVMSERSGIEIDYCPTCRGVWLDRGELDKIIERGSREFSGAAPAAPAAPTPPAAPAQPARPAQPAAPAYGQQGYQQPYDDRGYDNRGDNRGYDNRGYGDQGYRKKKKESWLSELFD